MKGIDLKKAVKNSGVKISELSEKSGIPEQTIYSLYKKESVEIHYLEKLKTAGIDLNNNKENYSLLELEKFKTTNELQNKLIDNLEKRIIDLTRENILLNKLVNLGIDKGILIVKK